MFAFLLDEPPDGVPDRRTTRLLDEVLALEGIPAAWRMPDFASTPLPLLPVQFAKDGVELAYFSLITTVGTPQDVTLQGIRLESFFPADDATEAHRWQRR
jgi:hypothetical protein